MALPFDRIVVLDFETRYSTKPQHWCPDGYTLRKQTTEEYIRSPMFKDFGASLKEFNVIAAVAQWYNPDELRRLFSYYDWSRTAVVCQNAAFDVAILSWKYGIEPAFIFDTLSMARALRGTKGRNGLKVLAQDFGLPDKGEALMLTDGLEELPQSIERKLAVYCNNDVYLCEEVFKRFLAMLPGVPEHEGWEQIVPQMYDMKQWLFPEKELRLIDMTVRMFTRPLLVLDGEMLGHALVDERETREGLLKRLNISDSDLASNDKFAEILRSLGVEPPLKKKRPTVKTPNPVGMNFAFAKTDAGFQSLLAHQDDNVVLLSEARLKVKSTTERTRAQRFLDISHRGTLPVPLHYYGALTGRWTACLVADTEVIVYDRHNGQCTKRIVDVLPDDLVWDGVEFVQHEGVQFSGYKEVITHDGITGTPDHRVFIDDNTSISLLDAQQRSQRIMDAAEPDSGSLEAARARLKRLRW